MSDANGQEIIITRKGSVPAVKGSEQTFSGDVSVEFLVPKRGDSRLSGGLVTFSAGARTHWHTHPYGQLLVVVDGAGRVQQCGGPLQAVGAGDLVWFPAGVKHWHGGAPDGSMTHYAIQEELDGQAVVWLEKVEDADYTGRPQPLEG